MRFDREEIKAQLDNLPREKFVLFAVRSAMRVLPLLAMQKKSLQSFGKNISGKVFTIGQFRIKQDIY